MDKIKLSVILTPEQIKQAKVVLQSTRYFKYHVVELHGIQFQGSWWGGPEYDYSASHWEIDLYDLDVINQLRMLGFKVTHGLPTGYREIGGRLDQFIYPTTEWVDAVRYFDEYYMYSDDGAVYRNHSQKERLIKSRPPTLEECLYIKHILPAEKQHYIPKEYELQIENISASTLWSRVDLNQHYSLDDLIAKNQNDFSHLTKPCRFDDE